MRVMYLIYETNFKSNIAPNDKIKLPMEHKSR